MIGRTLGHYEIVGKIGSGGMGEVWRAHDGRLERTVALKFVRTGGHGGRPLEALLREARAASALNHPNICTIHEVGESGPDAYIVMEHVDGETLADRIDTGPLPPEDVFALGIQIAAALVHAHGRGIVHRDLKSANIMVGPEDRIKVLDFGLSRRLAPAGEDLTRHPETLTDPGVVAGTIAYLSPEVLRGGAADERADLWALGVVLYEMSVSRRPFGGSTPYETSAAILRSDPPVLPPGIPAALRAVVERCLARDPATRFPAAGALREALEAAARGEGDARRTLRTLVVLPFEDLSGDESEEFFADGMTEAITAAIARLGSIRVISRTSAMQFKRERPPLPEIARRLNADAVVDGSVVRVGDRVRVTAQLIDAHADEHLWADRYDRALVNVLDLQDEVARAVVDGIRSRLGESRPRSADPRSGAPRTIDPRAYEEYLRGRHAWTKRTPTDLRKAIAHYQRVLELDPADPRAYTGIAECYAVLGFMGAAAPRSSFAPARAAARRALELDPSTGPAHITLGYVATHHRWELDEAADAFEAGLRLEPDDPNGRHWYALLLTSLGERDAAVDQLRSAAELDPLSIIVRAATGLVLYFFGELDAATAELRDALDMNPDYPGARWTLAKTLLARGEPEPARKLLEPLIPDRFPPALADYGRALGLDGRRDEARRVREQLRSRAARTYVRPYELALVHLGLGERGAALTALEQAFDEGGNWLNYLHLDPAFEELRGDSRFDSLVRRVAAGG